MLHARGELSNASGLARALNPEDIAARIVAWNRTKITPQELAKAANISVPNAKAALNHGNKWAGRFEAGKPNAAVPDNIRNKYAGAIKRARGAACGPAGGCENAKLDLLGNDKFSPDTLKPSMGHIGRRGKGFDHEFVITKEGYILDPVAQQAVDRGLISWKELKDLGLDSAVKEGIFTPDQWEVFKRLGEP